MAQTQASHQFLLCSVKSSFGVILADVAVSNCQKLHGLLASSSSAPCCRYEYPGLPSAGVTFNRKLVHCRTRLLPMQAMVSGPVCRPHQHTEICSSRQVPEHRIMTNSVTHGRTPSFESPAESAFLDPALVRRFGMSQGSVSLLGTPCRIRTRCVYLIRCDWLLKYAAFGWLTIRRSNMFSCFSPTTRIRLPGTNSRADSAISLCYSFLSHNLENCICIW